MTWPVLQDPVFATYVAAASIMILKAQFMPWLIVWRMMRAKGGFRSPEDLQRTPLNPDPNPRQLEPNERVERVRRIQQNDLESIPYFLVIGLLFLLTRPSLIVAQWLGSALKTAEARSFLVGLAKLKGGAKGEALRTEANRVGLSSCRLAEIWR